ncbi:MAG TPA: hypothetical protein VNZ49_15290 [Bacteroidia bacterium]|jgi:hypothetical protein|nr:hypothetical protein [Bacteroidia bacterium]
MAVYGIGAFYDGEYDVSGDFITNNIVGVGWDNNDAPELHHYLTSMKVGDVVYIKAAFKGTDITVKGIGIITDNTIIHNHQFASIARNIKWLSTQKFVIPQLREKNNVRRNTIYEEFHPQVLREIINRIG